MRIHRQNRLPFIMSELRLPTLPCAYIIKSLFSYEASSAFMTDLTHGVWLGEIHVP